ncbi:MAG: AAA family ATPase [Bacteroidota bacterium]
MIKKIAVIGPESTGKSELSANLARHYDTEWVPEYARFYLDRLAGEYVQYDLLEIAKGQIEWEKDKLELANDFLICDTNLIVIKIWSDHKYGNTDSFIEEKLKSIEYDFYLLTNIDLPWRADPQREHPTLRKHFLEVYKEYLESHNHPFELVSGIEDIRTGNAIRAINNFFGQ